MRSVLSITSLAFKDQPHLDLETKFALPNDYPSVLFPQLVFPWSRLQSQGYECSLSLFSEKRWAPLQSAHTLCLAPGASLCALLSAGMRPASPFCLRYPAHGLLDSCGGGGPLTLTENSCPVSVSRCLGNFPRIPTGLHWVWASAPDWSNLKDVAFLSIPSYFTSCVVAPIS